MKRSIVLALLALLSFASPSVASAKKDGKFNMLGLKVDVGVPDGLGFAAVVRPLRFLDLDLGGTTTFTGGGIRGGATIYLPWYISPSLTLEGGHQWGGDLNKLPVMFGIPNPDIALLRDVQYDYVSLRGGLGFGHPDWFMFYLRAGYTYTAYRTLGLQEFVQKTANDPSITVQEATAKLWTPSADIVFIIRFPPRLKF